MDVTLLYGHNHAPNTDPLSLSLCLTIATPTINWSASASPSLFEGMPLIRRIRIRHRRNNNFTDKSWILDNRESADIQTDVHALSSLCFKIWLKRGSMMRKIEICAILNSYIRKDLLSRSPFRAKPQIWRETNCSIQLTTSPINANMQMPMMCVTAPRQH